MAAVLVPKLGWTPRRRLAVTFGAAVLAAAIGVLLSQFGTLRHEPIRHPELWVLAGLAVLSALLAFAAVDTQGHSLVIICPTICFTFAILLCYGLGAAVVTQIVAAGVAGVRLRRPLPEAALTIGQYTLSFAAAEMVLCMGHPDPLRVHTSADIAADAGTVVAAIAAWLITYGLVELVAIRLFHNPRYARQTPAMIGNQLLFKASLLLLSPVIALAANINVGFVPLVFVPLYAVQRMARLSAQRDRAARIDPLTGLANRTGLKTAFAILTSDCAKSPHPGRRSALLIADLDGFKHVNDSLGHDVGDQLLVAVAQRLTPIHLDHGTIARLGGDEFAILAATTGPVDAELLARSVVRALDDPVSIDGLRVDITASIGVAVHTDPDEDFATLMRHADIAMYDAKQSGDTVAAYEPGSHQDSVERLALLTDFRQALETHDGQITMHYQPQVALTTGRVEGVEALLRWRHPSLGLINTQDLIGIAEHSSVMHLLTTRVIEEVIAQVAAWAAEGIRLRASINVSSRDLYSDAMVLHLARQLEEHRVDPDQIQIEITEGALLRDPSRVAGTVGRISRLGVAVALDDFGTGYSSLQHLRKLPITEIKVDRSFVAGMASNHDDEAIVRSTVEMARSLGIRTVAEGVETEYTRGLLAEAGCTLVQGWLTAHPMPAAEVAAWLRQAGVAPRQDLRSTPAPRSQAA